MNPVDVYTQPIMETIKYNITEIGREMGAPLGGTAVQVFCIYPQYGTWITVNVILCLIVILNRNLRISEKLIPYVKKEKDKEYLQWKNFNLDILSDICAFNIFMFTLHFIGL